MTCIMTGYTQCGVFSETFSAITCIPTASSILQNPLLGEDTVPRPVSLPPLPGAWWGEGLGGGC